MNNGTRRRQREDYAHPTRIAIELPQNLKQTSNTMTRYAISRRFSERGTLTHHSDRDARQITT